MADNLAISTSTRHFMIGINSKILQIGTLAKYTSTTSAEQNNVKQSSSTNTIPSAKIEISPQAREKYALEEQALKEQLTKKLKDSAMENVEEDKGDTDSEFLDKMIEQIQKQIKETQRELRSLDKDGSKQSRHEQKMLESKLMSLNGSLMGLLGKKLKALEENAK